VTDTDESVLDNVAGKTTSPVFCSFADHSQFSQAVPCMKWGWLLSCLIRWDLSSEIFCVLCSWQCLYFIQNKLL